MPASCAASTMRAMRGCSPSPAIRLPAKHSVHGCQYSRLSRPCAFLSHHAHRVSRHNGGGLYQLDAHQRTEESWDVGCRLICTICTKVQHTGKASVWSHEVSALAIVAPPANHCTCWAMTTHLQASPRQRHRSPRGSAAAPVQQQARPRAGRPATASRRQDSAHPGSPSWAGQALCQGLAPERVVGAGDLGAHHRAAPAPAPRGPGRRPASQAAARPASARPRPTAAGTGPAPGDLQGPSTFVCARE